MKPKQATDSRIKQALLKINPYLDILSPIASALWITISFVPVIMSFITLGAIPESTILQAFLISELGILFSRQAVSFSSWLSDTTIYVDNAKKSDNIANTLRGLQLSLLLISFFMASFSFLYSTLPTAIKAWTAISTTLMAVAQSPVTLLIAEICKYVPIVSIAAGVLGTSFYLYQAHQAQKVIERYQAKIAQLDNDHPQYIELYKKILEPGADIPKLCKRLPKEAEQYLFHKQFNENKKQESQKSRKTFLFWAGVCAVGIGITLLGAAAALTPLGAVAIAGAVTIGVIVKVATVLALLAVSCAVTRYYLKNKFYDAERTQMERAQKKIDRALQIIDENNQGKTNFIQPVAIQQKTLQGQPQRTALPATTKAASNKTSSNHQVSFFKSGAKGRLATRDNDTTYQPVQKKFKPRSLK